MVIWLPDRHKHQGRLVAAFCQQAAGVPCERKAVLAGGSRGADKEHALAEAGIDRSRYLVVSIDAVLEELARRSLIPVVAELSSMDAAGLVHAEAQHVAKRLAARALAEGRKLLLEITMASQPSVRSWLQVLDLAACTLEVVVAEISSDEAVRWAVAEHRRGHEQYRQGIGDGGRYVPPEAIRAASPAVHVMTEIDWAAVTAQLRRQRPGPVSWRGGVRPDPRLPWRSADAERPHPAVPPPALAGGAGRVPAWPAGGRARGR